MQIHHIAWLAGLFEGEGYVRYRNRCLHIEIGMTDGDVLERVHVLAGGYLRGPFTDGDRRHKPIWRWRITSRNAGLRFLAMIRPYLGVRRTAQVDTATSGLSELPERRQLMPPGACGWLGKASSAGAKRHRRRGEYPCEHCAGAEKQYNRTWRAANP